MTVSRRILFLAGRSAAFALALLLLGFGISIIPRGVLAEPTTVAWGTGLLAIVTLVLMLRSRVHLGRHHRGRDAHAELAFEMRHGRGLAGWRERALRHGRLWLGHSVDGSRPRFD